MYVKQNQKCFCDEGFEGLSLHVKTFMAFLA